jgi:hypothetical protein
MYSFSQNIAYSAVRIRNLSSVKTSDAIQFAKPNMVLSYNVFMEKYENSLKFTVFGICFCGHMLLHFGNNMDCYKKLNNEISREVANHQHVNFFACYLGSIIRI